jgi:hypothetical protein
MFFLDKVRVLRSGQLGHYHHVLLGAQVFDAFPAVATVNPERVVIAIDATDTPVDKGLKKC